MSFFEALVLILFVVFAVVMVTTYMQAPPEIRAKLINTDQKLFDAPAGVPAEKR